MLRVLLKLQTIFLSFCLFAFTQASAVARPADDCARVEVVSGTKCEDLKIYFDLSRCGDSSDGYVPILFCREGAGDVEIVTSRGYYHAPLVLQEDDDGTAALVDGVPQEIHWNVSGPVTRTSLQDYVTQLRKKEATQAATGSAAPIAPPEGTPAPSAAPAVTATAPAAPAAPVSCPAQAPTFIYNTEAGFKREQEVRSTPSGQEPPVCADLPPREEGKLYFGGSFRIRPENDYLTDYATKREFIGLRVRPDLTWKIDPKLEVFFEPQFTKFMGAPVYYFATNTTLTTQQTSGTSFDTTSIGVHQIYAKYKPWPWLTLMPGRQVLAYGNEIVIGASEFNTIATVFDAIRVRTDYSFGYTDLIYSKVFDYNTNTALAGSFGDREFYRGVHQLVFWQSAQGV